MAGRDVALRPKSFQVLCHLVKNAGRLISKEELIDAVWPSVTVTDESLMRCVSEVRAAIGDRDQTMIKTVSRRGYLFTPSIVREELNKPKEVVDSAATASPTATSNASLAVLPFPDLSGDREQEYFSDGVVEDIITELSRFSELRVIARNSSFQYKGKSVDVRQVGRELGVRYVLEGSVRRGDDRIRISAQLIDAETGVHRWAERYDRQLKDIFAVQDEVACTVAAILAAHVTKAETERTLLKPPATWQAYDHYMRATDAYATFHRPMRVASIYETRRFLENCLAIDPNFARAHVLLSATQTSAWILPLDGDHLNPAALTSALRSAERAVQLDPNLPQAHAQLGYVLGFMRRAEAGVGEFERAISLNPNFTDWRFAAVLIFAGTPDRALDAAKAHLRADPFALPVARGYMGLAYFMLKRYQDAVATLREFVSQAPNHRPGRMWLAATYGQLGLFAEARAEAAELLRIDPHWTSLRRFDKAVAHFQPNDIKHLADGLCKAGLADSCEEPSSDPA